MSIGVVKFSENLRTFSKNLTINTIMITLIILFLSWSKSLIFRVDSVNFELAKVYFTTKSSVSPKTKD